MTNEVSLGRRLQIENAQEKHFGGRTNGFTMIGWLWDGR
jgi:hypothetical protein